MILRILKSNQSVNYFLVVIIVLLTWILSILHPANYPFYTGENKNFLFYPLFRMLSTYPEISTGISILLILLISFLILHINSRYAFTRIRTMLPAPLYVLITGGLIHLHTFHPVYFGAIFLLIAIDRLFNLFNRAKPYQPVFDAGFWLGTGSATSA